MMLFCEPWFASLGFFYLFFAICHWLPNGKSAGQHYDDQEPHKLCRTWLAVEARRNLGSAARRAQRCKKQRRLAVRHVPECGRPGDGLENDTLLYFAAVQDVKGAFSIIGDGPSPASGRRDLNPRPLDPQQRQAIWRTLAIMYLCCLRCWWTSVCGSRAGCEVTRSSPSSLPEWGWWLGLLLSAGFPVAQVSPDRAAPTGSRLERPAGRTTWTRWARSGGLWCAIGERSAGFPERRGPGQVALAAGGRIRVVGPEALPAGGTVRVGRRGTRRTV